MAPEAAGEQASKQAQHGIVIDQRVLVVGISAIVICAVAALLVALLVIRNSPGGAGRTAGELSQVGPLFDAGEYTTNLAPGGDKQYIKVKVVFELSDKSLEKEVTQKLPVLQDRVLYFLNGKTSNQLGAEQRTALKADLLNDLNRYLTRGKIKQVYFSDLVMQ